MATATAKPETAKKPKTRKANTPPKAKKRGATKTKASAVTAKTDPKVLAKRREVRGVALASKGTLNSDQVKILRALKGTTATGAHTRPDIKKGVGINGKAAKPWLDSLKDLAERRLIVESYYEGDPKSYYHISAKGQSALDRAEKLFAAAAKRLNGKK